MSSADAEIDVSKAIAGLASNTTYYVRLFVRTEDGEVEEGNEIRYSTGDSKDEDYYQGPHPVNQPNSTTDIFFRTTTNQLGHDWYVPGSGWSSKTESGPTLASDPHPVNQPNGTTDIFFRTPSNELGHDWYVPGQGWASTIQSGPTLASDPHPINQPNGTTDIFFRTPTNELGHDWYVPGNGWASTIQSGPTLASDPFPVVQPNGTTDIFFRTPTNQLGHDWYVPGKGWFSKIESGPTLASDPHPIAQSNGTVDIFFRTPTNQLGHDWYVPGSGWASTIQSGPTLASDPHPVAQPNGTVDIYFRTTGGGLGHDWYVPGSGWASTIQSGPTLASEPHIVMLANGTADIFFRTTTGELGHDWYVPGSGWASANQWGPIKAPEPPKASTEAATEVKATSATLNANVNPEGSPTNYYFEYGFTTSYGSKAPSTPESIGYGTSKIAVNQILASLTAGKTYHYRVVAETTEGLSYGTDATFSTPSTATWASQTTVDLTPRTEYKLESTSCPSATMCMAAGKDNYTGRGFSEIWNGSAWSLTNNIDGAIDSISCVSTTWCMTVGKHPNGNVYSFRLQQSGGTWNYETKTPPVPSGGSEMKLADVSCTSEAACTAVGSYYNGTRRVTLAERYNGSSWSVQSTTNPASGDTELTGVSCTSSTFCMAVGRTGIWTYAETWNGTSWSSSTLPDPAGTSESRLQDISCNSSTACMTVGYFKEGNAWKKSFAERFNGSSWTISTPPSPAGANGNLSLLDVSCASASACISSGTYGTEKGAGEGEDAKAKTLIESWNGSAWSVQSSPNNEGKKFNSFNGVACSSSTTCTAVGAAGPSSSTTDGTVTLGGRYG